MLGEEEEVKIVETHLHQQRTKLGNFYRLIIGLHVSLRSLKAALLG
jgi:hypothetical protein